MVAAPIEENGEDVNCEEFGICLGMGKEALLGFLVACGRAKTQARGGLSRRIGLTWSLWSFRSCVADASASKGSLV